MPHTRPDAASARPPAAELVAIAVGGALGSAARWLLAELVPHQSGELPVSTWVANVTGAFALGALLALVVHRWPAQRLIRPFWGVGVLGGYTTFSTYMLETRALLEAGQPGRAGLYLFGTLVTGLAATWLGLGLGRALVTGRMVRTAGRHTDAEGSQS